jgi:hypothetical protein
MKYPLIFALAFSIGCVRLARADGYEFNNIYGAASGTWENEGGTPWYDSNTNTSNLPWDNSMANYAYFWNPGSGVTVSGQVDATGLEFVNSGTYTLNSDPSDPGLIEKVPGGGGLIVQSDSNNSDVTVNVPLEISTGDNTDRFNIAQGGSGSTLDLEGEITFTDSVPLGTGQTSYRSLIFNAYAPNETFILNGVNTSGTTRTINLRFNEGNSDTATLVLKGDYTTIDGGDFIDLPQGTVILDTSLTPGGNRGINTYNGGEGVTDNHTILTQGAQTIINPINAQVRNDSADQYGLVTIGGSTADLSTYSGNINADSTDVDLTAATGGRVEFTGSLTGSAPDGLVKLGSGVIDLTGANTYSTYYFGTQTTGTTAIDIKAGTVLINNPSGTSAFGNNAGHVVIEAGATLGGGGFIVPSGSTGNIQTVVAADATSVIAPGEPGYNSAAGASFQPAAGTLTLSGGLTAMNGLTMDFKLDSTDITDSDSIDFESGTVLVGGVLTINLTSLDGGVNTADTYTLFSGTGDWSGFNPTSVDINAPAGYTATGQFNPGGFNTYTVQFTATPEPSTYAMLLGGLALLGFVGLRRRQA